LVWQKLDEVCLTLLSLFHSRLKWKSLLIFLFSTGNILGERWLRVSYQQFHTIQGWNFKKQLMEWAAGYDEYCCMYNINKLLYFLVGIVMLTSSHLFLSTGLYLSIWPHFWKVCSSYLSFLVLEFWLNMYSLHSKK